MDYTKGFTDALQFIWGEGFLSPGGPDEVAAILMGSNLGGHRVLDIGSGLGGIDLLLATRFGAGSIVGIDVDPDLVAAARALVESHGLARQITFECVTPGPLAFADASFDTVFSKDAMVHVADKLGLYREVARVLRPGGTFRAGDWLWAQGAETHPAVMDWLGGGPLHFVFTTPDEARAALHDAGLKDVKVIDRRAGLQASDRALVERLNGPDYRALCDLVGEEQALARRRAAQARLTAVNEGQLIPCHLFARCAG